MWAFPPLFYTHKAYRYGKVETPEKEFREKYVYWGWCEVNGSMKVLKQNISPSFIT